MTEQLALPLGRRRAPRAAHANDAPALVCAFGEPWMGDHPLCAAEAARGLAEFARLVAAGVFDAEGYTPADRRAQQRRAAKGAPPAWR